MSKVEHDPCGFWLVETEGLDDALQASGYYFGNVVDVIAAAADSTQCNTLYIRPLVVADLTQTPPKTPKRKIQINTALHLDRYGESKYSIKDVDVWLKKAAESAFVTSTVDLQDARNIVDFRPAEEVQAEKRKAALAKLTDEEKNLLGL